MFFPIDSLPFYSTSVFTTTSLTKLHYTSAAPRYFRSSVTESVKIESYGWHRSSTSDTTRHCFLSNMMQKQIVLAKPGTLRRRKSTMFCDYNYATFLPDLAGAGLTIIVREIVLLYSSYIRIYIPLWSFFWYIIGIEIRVLPLNS